LRIKNDTYLNSFFSFLIVPVQRSITAPLPAAITVFQYRHFAFTSLQQPAYIFLVGQQHHQCHSDGEYPVQWIVDIENYEDKNREGDTCQN
jgi:hypothetical protein